MPYKSLRVKQQANIEVKKPRLFGFLAGLILGFLLVFSVDKVFLKKQLPASSTQVLSLTDTDSSPAVNLKNLKTLGILLLGYGGEGHPGGYLTDAIQVVFIDFEKSRLHLISVPRDLWVKFPGQSVGKINTTITMLSEDKDNRVLSGAKNMKNYLSQILGLNLDYFIGVDFVGFQRAIGLNLKGIEVEVGETLDDPWYPVQGLELETCGKTAGEVADLSKKYSGFELERQFPCRYEHLHFEKGTVLMQGGEALKYARSRHGSTAGDISRGIRQQEVLTAVRKKLLSLNVLPGLPDFFRDIVKHTVTDIDADIVKYLLPAAGLAFDFQINRINLSTDNVLSTGNVGSAAVIMPKDGLHNYTGIQNFIQSQIRD